MRIYINDQIRYYEHISSWFALGLAELKGDHLVQVSLGGVAVDFLAFLACRIISAVPPTIRKVSLNGTNILFYKLIFIQLRQDVNL